METHKTPNTVISALITLQRFKLGVMRLRKLVRQHKETLDPMPDRDFDVDEHAIGVTVWENIYARIPVPSELFLGDYDQRSV